MSSENLWGPVLQELAARGLPFWIDVNDPEPWLGYKSIAHLSGDSPQTIENKAAGLSRHPLWPMIKVSHLEAKQKAKAEAKEKADAEKKKKKAPRKRPPGRK